MLVSGNPAIFTQGVRSACLPMALAAGKRTRSGSSCDGVRAQAGWFGGRVECPLHGWVAVCKSPKACTHVPATS